MKGKVRHAGEIGYRSSDLGEVQGYEDLRMIWGALRDAGRGKRADFKPEVKKKIVRGLKRTVNEGGSSRIRLVASAIVLAIAEEDWERDVYRSNRNTRGR